MHDIHQIQVINRALNKEREHQLYELQKLNVTIERKINLIKKMMSYLKEYYHESNFKKSKSVPVLHKNFDSFTHQIEDVINKTEIEANNLKKNQEIVLKKIEKIDQKIKLINFFEERLMRENLLREEKSEQLAIDDLSSTKHLRG